MRGILFTAFVLAGCASVLVDNKQGQGKDSAAASGTYSITTLYDGDTGSRERAAKWLDTEARNICASDYTLISEETVPIMNYLGEVTDSRLIWKIKCLQQTERANAP
ncbi:hypothetical protein SAMN05216387_103104 [Nitrosovibrio tenuis]|uniref:Uncharacterized protein n=2 Tax=Nitrosovibrio tenuis TaxID=1233 RepID=A0A1H7K724_9PROT|nr:hypothetical protein SAMN05216387_103104 [Nitrosovibrio tenuis]